MRKSDSFIPNYKLSQDYVEQKGGRDHYWGMFENIDVYLSKGLNNNQGVLYEKNNSYLRLIPLEVLFDSYESPRLLVIRESLYAWSESDTVISLDFS